MPHGVILGAQAVAPDGIDKRIDVLGTAMRNRMRAEDLIDLDGATVSALVLYVRSRQEPETGQLPGSLNIPHTELRGCLDEVRRRGRSSGASPLRVGHAFGYRTPHPHPGWIRLCPLRSTAPASR